MQSHPMILVGTDGSAAAQGAVRWAAVEAVRRDAELTILHAYDESWTGLPEVFGDGFVDTLRTQAEAVVADARVAAQAVAPGLSVHARAVPDDPAKALLRHAADAGLVVVGHRGRGGFTSLMLGSVGLRVVTHAPCSVAVVRGRVSAFDGPVVVGVDASPDARLALETAFAAAETRRTTLLAVHGYPAPLPPVGGMGAAPFAPVDEERLRAEESRLVADLLAPARDKFPAVPVQTRVTGGSPARLLVGASHAAQLVVVGSRGLGAVAGTLLGSVSLQLLHHADCPVLVSRA